MAEAKQNSLLEEESRLQKELAMAKQDIDEINKEVEAQVADNLRMNQANMRAKSNQDSVRPARQPDQDQQINIDLPIGSN